MGLFYLAASKEPLNFTCLQKELVKRQVSIQIEHGHVDYYSPTPYIFIAHYPVDTNFTSIGNSIYRKQLSSESCTMTVLQGYCYDREFPESFLNAKEIHRIVTNEESDIESIRRRLGGDYSVLHVDDKGDVSVFNDLCGLEHVYYYLDDCRLTVSNRLSLIENRDHYSFDFISSLSQPLTGFMTSDGTYLTKVRKLRITTHLKSLDGQFKEVSAAPYMYDFGRISLPADNLKYELLLSKGIDEICSLLRLTTVDQEIVRLPITGGKDSRAVLALCLLAGLEEKIELFTFGEKDHPEVVVGASIAKLMNLPHTVKPRARPKDISVLEFYRNIAIHAFQVEGLMTPWDIQNRGPYSNGVQITGFCGEYLRPFNDKDNIDLSDHSSIKDIFRYYDPLDVIDDVVRKNVIESTFEELSNYTIFGAENADMANLYHASGAYSGWLGAAGRLSSYMSTAIKPLNSYYLNNLAFGISSNLRSLEIIHYDIISRVGRNLLEQPFFRQRWHPDLLEHNREAGVNVEPIVGNNSFPVHGSWQYQFNNMTKHRKEALYIIDRFKQSELWNYVNREKIVERLKSHSFNGNELHSVLGIFGVLFKCEKIEIPRKAHHQKTQLDSFKIALTFLSDENSQDSSEIVYDAIKNSEIKVGADSAEYSIAVNSYAAELVNGGAIDKRQRLGTGEVVQLVKKFVYRLLGKARRILFSNG